MGGLIKLSSFAKLVPYAEMFGQGLVITVMLSVCTVLVGSLLGVVLALGTCIALFWPSDAETEGIFSYPLIFAFVFAMIIPNIIERQGLRKINLARKTMVIALAIGVLVFFLYTGYTHGFQLFRS